MKPSVNRFIIWVILPIILIAAVAAVIFVFSGNFSFPPEATPSQSESEELPIAAGVVPHHLLAQVIIDDFFQRLSNYSPIEVVILFSPDHYNQAALTGGRFITISPQREEGKGKNDSVSEIINTISQNQLVEINDFSVGHDQGVANLMPFFEKYLPDTKVIPILISPQATKEETQILVEQLNEVVPKNTIFIASVDFSHYLPDPVLLLHDVRSIRTLINLEDDFRNIDVDSWQSLYGVRYFAQLKNKEKAKIIAHKTTYDFIRTLPENSLLSQEGGVSYYSVIFEKGKKQEIFPRSILMVGDIMMARGVALLTDKYGLEYPFEKIKDMFRGVDIVYGNLEGPVMANAPVVSMRSVNFAYSPEIVKLLRKLGFTVLNLANNHTKDKGARVLQETREFLQENDIHPLGDFQSCDSKYYYREGNIVIIGANLVYKNSVCVQEIVKNVKKIKEENPDSYIIVTPHWGTEYTPLPNKFQVNTAHRFIDAGVDTVIGHHPHVVQAIEEYKGKLIFYSLGNFVFDMYFSPEVQQELAVGIEHHLNKVVFYLIPISSHKSQLSFMRNKEKDVFLNWLANISSTSLRDSIRRGIIKVNLNGE
ncbi:AmmeMemoRadiSam system protein B [bacterium]|nr:AmmeMemoRadiSam system protein B [bacterium]